VRLLLDEMYPPRLAAALTEIGIDARTVAEERLGGSPDADVFAAACGSDRAVLTENVADFTRLAAGIVTAGDHHCGVLIAPSTRFSRRPAGLGRLISAVALVADEEVADRVIYLR
jgi:hypothetical protein